MTRPAYQCNECAHVKVTSTGIALHLANAHGISGSLDDHSTPVTVDELFRVVGKKKTPVVVE
jgi:hypothetical protein